MDRQQFINLAQQVSTLPSGVFNIKLDVPIDLQVIYNGTNYYPLAYEIAFKNGKPIHTAVLHDLKANCVVNVPLNLIESAEK